MSDLIDRESAIDAIYHHFPEKSREECAAILHEVTSQPEQKKGKWIIEEINKYELSYGTIAYEPVYRCAVCDRLTESYLRLDEPIMPEEADFPRFCPWCGAKMEETKDV